MLNRTVLIKQGDTHEHVTINQQPHDAADAARLYGEIEDKAKSSIENLVAHEAPNAIKFVTYTRNVSYINMGVEHYVAFAINGNPFTVRVSYDDYQAMRAGSYLDVMEKIILPSMVREVFQAMYKVGRLKEVFPS